MNFFIIVDEKWEVVELYEMIYFNVMVKIMVCIVFVIGLDKKIKLILIYLFLIGCNF